MTLPRESGATSAALKVAYWPAAVTVPERSPAKAMYSISGQSAGKLERSDRAAAERFARDEGGNFSQPVSFEQI